MPLAAGIYFLTLVAQLPYMLALVGATGALFLLLWHLLRLRQKDPIEAPPALQVGIGIFLLVAAIGCGLRARWYGDWDAALIWNLHARYLTTPDWKVIFEPGISGNNTYPYGLPGFVALLWRAVGSFSPVVPLLAALIPTLAIPALVVLQRQKAGWKGALLIALSFLTYRYYFALGLTQYADIQIAFQLLLLFIVFSRYRQTGFRKYLALAGALCGALCWTKMEGFLLSGIFLLTHVRVFTRKPAAMLYLLSGLLPFVLFWWVLKAAGIPHSPLLISGKLLLAHLSDGGRFWETMHLYGEVLFVRHYRFLILLLLYAALWVRRRRRFPAGFAFISGAVLAYFLLYWLLVTTDLGWNITTSLPRLLLQLYPTLVFLTVGALQPASSTTHPSAASGQSGRDGCGR